jgi:hypothetical protein
VRGASPHNEQTRRGFLRATNLVRMPSFLPRPDGGLDAISALFGLGYAMEPFAGDCP